jgi:nucleoside-diphosphate-sugar epimerase
MITGSTGFIGAVLAATCQARGDEVVALGQTNTTFEKLRKTQLQAAGIEVMPVPMDDRAGLEDCARGVDLVVHLAAAQHEANVPDQHFRNVNVEGTRMLLDACAQAGVSRFVLGSTIGVYGSPGAAVDESTPVRPDNIYGETKLEGERVAGSFVDRMHVCIVRISETYGPGDGRLLKLFKAIKKRAFFVIGRGENLHQLIHVDDLVRGLLAAAERPEAKGETLILAGTERLTTIEMCDAVAGAVGVGLRGFRAPMWPFDLAAVCAETICRPLGVQPPLHRRRLDFFKKSFLLDTKKAADLLGFKPTIPFRDGAANTAEWYIANGFL